MIEIPTINELPKMEHSADSEGFTYPDDLQDKLVLCKADGKYYFFKGAKAMPIERGLIDVIIPFVHDAIDERLETLDIKSIVTESVEPQFEDIEEAFNEIRERLDAIEELDVKEFVNKQLKIVHENMGDLIDTKVKEFEEDIMGKLKVMKDQATESEPGSKKGLTLGSIFALKEAGFTTKEIASLGPLL